MAVKLIMDSAGDIQSFEGMDFACVPLKILAGEREFVDDQNANVAGMVEFLKGYHGKSGTACPGVGEYLDAFGEAEEVYCITITGGLSGSYGSAAAAADTYREQHPDRKIHVFDSLSTGPEMVILAEKIRELLDRQTPFEEVVRQVTEYQKHTQLVFALESLHNLANNGRVPAAVAKVVGILGIRLVGIASEKGTLQPTGKARGEKKVIPEVWKLITSLGYQGGKVRIAHCNNLPAAETLRQTIREQFPGADVDIWTTGALCSFYAEEGGLLVGFETQ